MDVANVDILKKDKNDVKVVFISSRLARQNCRCKWKENGFLQRIRTNNLISDYKNKQLKKKIGYAGIQNSQEKFQQKQCKARGN